MVAKYIQPGNNLDYKNTADTTIEANSVISLGTRIGIAGTVIMPGETGSVVTEGVFEFDKAAEAFAVGAAAYYDAAADNIVSAESGVPAGYVVADAKADDKTVKVKLLG